MDSPHTGKVWLEPLLAQHLGPVEAPAELWDRVQSPQPLVHKRRIYPRRVWGLTWAVAAVALLVVTAALVWQFRLRPEALVARALKLGAEDIEFRSENSAAIRQFVKERTGLDVPLLAEPPASIRLVGASIADWAHTPTAKVVYQVGGRDAILLVSKADPKLTGSHRFLSSGQYQGARVSTWVMRGQLCTLACPIPQNPQAGCLLCHATGAPRALLN